MVNMVTGARRFWNMRPFWLRAAALYGLMFMLLLLLEHGSFIAAQVPLTIGVTPRSLSIAVDGSVLQAALPSAPDAIILQHGDPAVREFQLDGSDSINNFSQDISYIDQLTDTPYYRFQAWMRDFPSYSSWQQVTARNASTERLLPTNSAVDTSSIITLPPGANVTITASIERLEVPVQAIVICGNNPCGSIIVDRNNRILRLQSLSPDGIPETTEQVYFPTQPLPFIAEVANLLTHVALWSLLVLGLLMLLHVTLSAFGMLLADGLQMRLAPPQQSIRRYVVAIEQRQRMLSVRLVARFPRWLKSRALQWDRWDGAAGVVVLLAFGFTCWIALVQYQAEPHILDASAYFFQAKIFASGQLSAPVPANLAAFQGPFMVAYQGHWFAQYPPATSALLALGLLLHVPWLVESLLGALALWGIYKIGRLLFAPHEALLAIMLGALSPFYLYLAASYLSHTISLFFGVYFLYCLLRFNQRFFQRDLILAAVCAGGLLLTRELTAVLLCGGATLLVFALHWQRWWDNWREIVVLVLLPLSVAVFFIGLYLSYNALQTGNPLLLPRTVFFPADQYGFGVGIGFYGEHTLAAGFVVLDQLLTILLIDLYGWPFYLTLVFLPLAFLRCRQQHRWDVFCLALGGLLIFAQVGYFYHGIYLGPRYLFDALPFLLLLSARGITGAFGVLLTFARRLLLVNPTLRSNSTGDTSSRPIRLAAYALVAALVLILVSCNLFYYLPRQVALYQDYSGLPSSTPVQVKTIYAFHPNHALVVTDNSTIYNYVLFPLNDPNLQGKTLYAYLASTTTFQQLAQQYPSRTLYLLHVASDGTVTFIKLSP